MRGVMFLRHTKRKKDGKEHRYWSIVENRRVGGGRVVQRPLLYLGEINDSQELAWRKSIAIVEEGTPQPRTLSLFPEDCCEGLLPDASIECGHCSLGWMSESGSPERAGRPRRSSRRNGKSPNYHPFQTLCCRWTEWSRSRL